MKAITLICLFYLIALSTFGQSSTTKIFFVKNGATTLGATQFYTTLEPNQVISVRNNGYTVIETCADSLGIFRSTSYADTDYQHPVKKPKPTFIKLEFGKSYYFKIGSAIYNQHLDIEEMTERAFQLYVGLNELSDNPKKYVLGNSKTLFRTPQ
jgi:hypothetical protein